jgi:hypothetical protein
LEHSRRRISATVGTGSKILNIAKQRKATIPTFTTNAMKKIGNRKYLDFYATVFRVNYFMKYNR